VRKRAHEDDRHRHGQQKGAEICHELGVGKMAENILFMGRVALAKANIVCGVGILENAYHETARLEVLAKEDIPAGEPAPEEARACTPGSFRPAGRPDHRRDRKRHQRHGLRHQRGGPLPHPLRQRRAVDHAHRGSRHGQIARQWQWTGDPGFHHAGVRQIQVRENLSQLAHIHCSRHEDPHGLENDRQAIQAAIKTCNILDKAKVRLARIKNTVTLDEISVSENLTPEVSSNGNLEAIGKPYRLSFNEQGNFF
jgi:hypothetical protein